MPGTILQDSDIVYSRHTIILHFHIIHQLFNIGLQTSHFIKAIGPDAYSKGRYQRMIFFLITHNMHHVHQGNCIMIFQIVL